MKILRIFFLCLSVMLLQSASARDISDFFKTAPDSITKLLPQSVRLDMLDYYHFGSDKASANMLGGDARVLQENERTLLYQLTDSAEVQMCMIAANDTILAVVETLKVPYPDSKIDFYDKNWHKIKAPTEIPTYENWITDAGREHIDELTAAMPFTFVKAEFSPNAETLNFSLQIPSGRGNNKITGWLKENITYQIRGTKFYE